MLKAVRIIGRALPRRQRPEPRRSFRTAVRPFTAVMGTRRNPETAIRANVAGPVHTPCEECRTLAMFVVESCSESLFVTCFSVNSHHYGGAARGVVMRLQGILTAAALCAGWIANTAGSANAQLAPQFYVGLGGSYSSSGYRAGEIDYNFPLLTKGTWSPESTALGIAGFGLAGVRFAAPGMYLGIEGQISSPSYSEKSVVRSVTFNSSSDFF